MNAGVAPVELAPALARKLVMRLRFVAGESLPSYVDRLAALYGTTLQGMLSRLGFLIHGEVGLAGYGVVLSEAAHKQFARVSGLSENEVARMLLSRPFGSAISIPSELWGRERGLIRRDSVAEWAYFKGSHFCARCLEESGGIWLNRWKLPWSFACVRHGVMLIDACPHCGRRPRAGRSIGLHPPFLEHIPEPMRCNNAYGTKASPKGRESRPCGCSFVNLPVVPATMGTLAAQRTIDDALDKMTETSPEGTKDTFFDELRSLCALILYAFSLEDVDMPLKGRLSTSIVEERNKAVNRQPGLRLIQAYSTKPTSTTLMAAVVERAVAMLVPYSHERVSAEMQRLANQLHARDGTGNGWKVAKNCHLSERLENVYQRCFAKHANFDRRTGVLSVNAKTEPCLYQSCHVPQLIAVKDFDVLFRHLFPHIRDYRARRFCSMAAVKLLGGTWLHAAAALDLPVSAARQASSFIWHLNRTGNYEKFDRALRDWVVLLNDPASWFDLRKRRQALDAVTEFPASDWIELCRQVGMSPGRGGRSRFAVAWMWADATGGDWRLSPVLVGASKRGQATQYQALMNALQPRMKAVLRAFVEVRFGSIKNSNSLNFT